MSVIQNNWTSSRIAVLSCLILLNLFSEQVPYYLFEIPYLFNLFADRAEASLERKVPSSKLLQFFSVLIFRLTKPFIFQVYFQEFNLDQLYDSIVDVTIFASFFYMIPFKYWQSLRNHRIGGNIINTLDAFGAAEVMIYLVQGTLKSASFFQYILIVVISNAVESIISWVMYKNEGSDESLHYFLLSIQQTLLIEMKSCLMNIFLFVVLHSQTKMSKIIHKVLYSNCSNSSNTILLEYFTNFLYAEDAIRSFNFSSPISLSTPSISQDIISTVPILHKQELNVKQNQYHQQHNLHFYHLHQQSDHKYHKPIDFYPLQHHHQKLNYFNPLLGHR